MPRRPLALCTLLAAAALAAPSPAQAKQIQGLTVCGADGCHAVERAIGQALHDVGGAALAGAPGAAAHYRLVLKIGDGRRTLGTDRVIYVPSTRAMGGAGGWYRVSDGTARKLAHALAGHDPLPAGALTKDVAALDPPGTSLPPEVVLPPKTTRAASSGDGVPWWAYGGGALLVLAALAFIGNSQVRRR